MGNVYAESIHNGCRKGGASWVSRAVRLILSEDIWRLVRHPRGDAPCVERFPGQGVILSEQCLENRRSHVFDTLRPTVAPSSVPSVLSSSKVRECVGDTPR